MRGFRTNIIMGETNPKDYYFWTTDPSKSHVPWTRSTPSTSCSAGPDGEGESSSDQCYCTQGIKVGKQNKLIIKNYSFSASYRYGSGGSFNIRVGTTMNGSDVYSRSWSNSESGALTIDISNYQGKTIYLAMSSYVYNGSTGNYSSVSGSIGETYITRED